jgi:membrane protease YdiL (CAAX protease family)
MTRPGAGEEPQPSPQWYPPPPGYGFPPPPPPQWYPPPPGYGFPPSPPPWNQQPWNQQPWNQQAWNPAPWQKLPPPLPHDVPRPFLHVMRSRTWAWWKPVLGLLLFAVVYTVSAIVAVAVAFLLVLPAGGDLVSGLSGEDLTDPGVLLVTNASVVVAIPVLWLVWTVAHQMRIGWSSSVLGRLRWRLFLLWTPAALGTLGLLIVVSFVLDLVTGAAGGGPGPAFGWLVLVVLLTTPVQSAAEEYVFRGYLSQAVAGWFREERVGAVVAALVSAVLFSLAHVPPDWASFLDRFAVGLAASAVVRLTGGLEASIALHAVNNVLVFLLAGALGEGSTAGGSQGEGLPSLLLTVVGLAGYVALVARLRGRVRPEVRTRAQDMRPGVLPPLPGASGIVSSWRREVPYRPWGMG